MCVPHPGMCTRRLPYWLTHSRDILLTEYVQKVLGKWILPSDSTFFLSLLLFWILFHSLLFNYPSNKYLKGDFMPGIFLGSKFMLNCNCTFHSTRMAGATLWNHFFFTPSLSFIQEWIIAFLLSVASGIVFNVSILFPHPENNLVWNTIIEVYILDDIHFDSNGVKGLKSTEFVLIVEFLGSASWVVWVTGRSKEERDFFTCFQISSHNKDIFIWLISGSMVDEVLQRAPISGERQRNWTAGSLCLTLTSPQQLPGIRAGMEEVLEGNECSLNPEFCHKFLLQNLNISSEIHSPLYYLTKAYLRIR